LRKQIDDMRVQPRSPPSQPHSVPDSAPLRVLIVEDAASVASLVEAFLQSEAMATRIALSGAEALVCKRNFQPDIVLIDLGLPDVDGMDLVGRFARERDCGVIVVTASDGEGARVAGLELGADDYMVKPAPLRELAARIRAVHRRLTRPEVGRRPYPRPVVTLEAATRCLTGPSGTTTPLTEAEFITLQTLLNADGASVSRDWLGKVALKRPLGTDDRSVDQLVMKLRRKLAVHGVTDRTILSARGLGYVIPEPSRFAMVAVSQPLGTSAAAQTVAPR
jgi:two-component system OmpR family response regulator